jgi:hypothetical protein
VARFAGAGVAAGAGIAALAAGAAFVEDAGEEAMRAGAADAAAGAEWAGLEEPETSLRLPRIHVAGGPSSTLPWSLLDGGRRLP